MRLRFVAYTLAVTLSMTLVSCKITDDKINNKASDKNKVEDTTNKDKVTNRKARLYYFDTSKSKLYYLDKDIEVSEDNLLKSLNTALSDTNKNKALIAMVKDAEVDKVELDNETGVLTVKFKENIFQKLKLGDISESGFYQSLILTYAYNYNVDKVAIYLAGELYTGLKGELPEGYSLVDLSQGEELQDEDAQSSNIEKVPCRVFYYTGDEDKIYYVDTSMEVVDKAVVSGLTKALKTAPSDKFYKLEEDVNVTTASLDNDTGILTVNLNKEYYNILSKVGSGSEAGVLRSVAFTYGYYYKVDKVIIKVGGENYSGGHIAYQDGEYIKVDTTDIQALPAADKKD